MFAQSFSVCYSPLSLLKLNEKGVITRLKNHDIAILQNLSSMGVNIGLSIKLEQKFPDFIVKVGKSYLTFDRQTANSIYVRVVNEK